MTPVHWRSIETHRPLHDACSRRCIHTTIGASHLSITVARLPVIVSVTSSVFLRLKNQISKDEPDLKLKNAILLQDLKDQRNSAARPAAQPSQLGNQVSRATRPLGHRTSLIMGQPATVNTIEGVDLLMPQITPMCSVSFVLTMTCLFFQFLPVHHQSFHLLQAQLCRSAIRTNFPCDVRYVGLPRASGDIVFVSGPSMV